jgi:hypothetical protein
MGLLTYGRAGTQDAAMLLSCALTQMAPTAQTASMPVLAGSW